MSDPVARLPARPSLEQLRKQAHELSRSAGIPLHQAQREIEIGGSPNITRAGWRCFHPGFVHTPGPEEFIMRSGSTIVAPVSRILAVADVARSLAFYRDVLGFESRPPAVVSGPAHIELVAGDAAPDSTGARRPRGAALLFFEMDDVAAFRDVVVARGGHPSELEQVNWIKMRVFQMQDPDGHTLWFGQSFQEPDRPKDPARQLRQALPMLPLSDVAAGIAHYQQALGFHINYAQADLGVMYRDDVTLLLIQRTAPYTGIASCEAYINDADALHAELVQRGANVQGSPISHPWGLRDFTVLDLEGNRLIFAQAFE